MTVALSDGHLQLTGLPEIAFTGVLVSTASGVAGSLTLSVANLAIGDATLTAADTAEPSSSCCSTAARPRRWSRCPT